MGNILGPMEPLGKRRTDAKLAKLGHRFGDLFLSQHKQS